MANLTQNTQIPSFTQNTKQIVDTLTNSNPPMPQCWHLLSATGMCSDSIGVIGALELVWVTEDWILILCPLCVPSVIAKRSVRMFFLSQPVDARRLVD